MYGRRDYDEGTDSYIATLYFVIAFVPLFPLACYRVQTAGMVEDFWGRFPLPVSRESTLASLWLECSSSFSSPASPRTRLLNVLRVDVSTIRIWVGAYAPIGQPIWLILPAAMYSGSVINAMFKNTPGTLRITLDSVADTTTGYVTIGGHWAAAVRSTEYSSLTQYIL